MLNTKTLKCWKCNSLDMKEKIVRVGRLRTSVLQIQMGAPDNNIYRTFYVCQNCGYRLQPHLDRYLKLIVYNRERNDKFANLAARFVKARQATLVFVELIEHADIVAMLIRGQLESLGLNPAFCAVVHGKLDSEDNDKTKQKFLNSEVFVIVTTKIYGEGTNLPNLKWILYAKAGLPGIELEQMIGRALRRPSGKYHAGFIDSLDEHDKAFAAKSRARKKFLAAKGFPVIVLQPDGIKKGIMRFVRNKTV